MYALILLCSLMQPAPPLTPPSGPGLVPPPSAPARPPMPHAQLEVVTGTATFRTPLGIVYSVTHTAKVDADAGTVEITAASGTIIPQPSTPVPPPCPPMQACAPPPCPPPCAPMPMSCCGGGGHHGRKIRLFAFLHCGH
jgi:hypothetical protein